MISVTVADTTEKVLEEIVKKKKKKSQFLTKEGKETICHH